MDKEEALAFADQEAAEAVSALASAGDLIQFNSGRHQQIVSLARRVRDLQMRSKMFYAAPGNLNVVPQGRKTWRTWRRRINEFSKSWKRCKATWQTTSGPNSP